MDQGNDVGKNTFRGFRACLDETGILFRVQFQMPHALFRNGNAVPSVPKHAVGGFVSDFGPFWGDTVIFQALQHVDGMVSDILLHLFKAMTHPGGRNGLGLGIGPGVAVVETQQDFHSKFFGDKRFGEDVLLVTEADVVGRVGRIGYRLSRPHPRLGIDPDTKADGVQPQFFHQGRTLAGFPRFVLVLEPPCFLGPGETDVGAEPVRLRCLGFLSTLATGQQKKRKEQPQDSV